MKNSLVLTLLGEQRLGRSESSLVAVAHAMVSLLLTMLHVLFAFLY